MNPTPWIVSRRVAAARLRLICFAYAGGSAASFLDWAPELPPEVSLCAVQLPGRGMRFHEPALSEMAPIVRELSAVLAAEDDLPTVFFGHSLGCLLAFEVTRALVQRGAPTPRRLVLAGCHAPQHRGPGGDLHLKDDEALIEELRNYAGTPPEVLAHRELMSLVLPAIRADFALAETYRYEPGPQLDIPFTVLFGTEEERASMRQVEGWQDESSQPMRLHWFEGGHFFIHSQRQQVLECVREELRAALSQPAVEEA